MTTPDTPSAPLQTTVNRGWLLRRIILPAVILFGIGVWGLIDATIIYPRNGRLDASFKLNDYLKAAEESHRLTSSFVKVEDQRAELDKLAAREGATAGKDALTPLERGRMNWLRSLKMVWSLGKPEIWVADVKRPLVSKTGDEVYAGVGGVSDVKHEITPMFYRPATGEGYLLGKDNTQQTIAIDAVARNLKEYWTTGAGSKKTPSALAFYDLPLQWFFTVGGFGGALYLIVLYLRVGTKKYQFEPETHTLILPGGVRVAPSDVKEVDKRKWHKFYVTLHMKDGTSRTLDLMRHDPLEEWVLAIEKTAFPEVKPDEGTKDEEGPDGEPPAPDALAVPKDVGHVSSMTYGGTMDGAFALVVFDAAALRVERSAPAYAQGEVLKALGVALRDEGGWRQWLTCACGEVRGAAAKTVVDMFAEREPTFKVVFKNGDPGTGEAAASPEWYVVIVGRLSEPVARRLNDILMDPPLTGFVAFGALKRTPPTIDRFTQALSLEAGLEIKGETLVGSWEVSREDQETAGLKAAAGEGAVA